MIAEPLVGRQIFGEILRVPYFVMSLKGNLQFLCGVISTCKVITSKDKDLALKNIGLVG